MFNGGPTRSGKTVNIKHCIRSAIHLQNHDNIPLKIDPCGRLVCVAAAADAVPGLLPRCCAAAGAVLVCVQLLLRCCQAVAAQRAAQHLLPMCREARSEDGINPNPPRNYGVAPALHRAGHCMRLDPGCAYVLRAPLWDHEHSCGADHYVRLLSI